MAVSAADKAAYAERLKAVKPSLERLRVGLIKKKAELEAVPPGDLPAWCKVRFDFSKYVLSYISWNLLVSRLGQKYIAFKNEAQLDEARKHIHLFYSTLEEIGGGFIDSLDDEGEKLAAFDVVVPNRDRMILFQKAGVLLDLIEKLYGENSKWKWGFVDMKFRLAVAFKNSIHIKELQKNLDPMHEHYNDMLDCLALLQKFIGRSADDLRNRYEMKEKVVGDMKRAIDLVSFQRRLAAVMGEDETVDTCKRKVDSWTKKLNEDFSAEDQKKYLAAAQKGRG